MLPRPAGYPIIAALALTLVAAPPAGAGDVDPVVELAHARYQLEINKLKVIKKKIEEKVKEVSKYRRQAREKNCSLWDMDVNRMAECQIILQLRRLAEKEMISAMNEGVQQHLRVRKADERLLHLAAQAYIERVNMSVAAGMERSAADAQQGAAAPTKTGRRATKGSRRGQRSTRNSRRRKSNRRQRRSTWRPDASLVNSLRATANRNPLRDLRRGR